MGMAQLALAVCRMARHMVRPGAAGSFVLFLMMVPMVMAAAACLAFLIMVMVGMVRPNCSAMSERLIGP